MSWPLLKGGAIRIMRSQVLILHKEASFVLISKFALVSSFSLAHLSLSPLYVYRRMAVRRPYSCAHTRLDQLRNSKLHRVVAGASFPSLPCQKHS